MFWSGLKVGNRRERHVSVCMTGACTVSQFAGRVLDLWCVNLVVAARIKIIGMTTTAVRLKGRGPPADGLGIARMAG